MVLLEQNKKYKVKKKLINMSNKKGALSDLRVIEMGQLLAGPFCGQLLGDFGAEVIKWNLRDRGPNASVGHMVNLWWISEIRNHYSKPACRRRSKIIKELIKVQIY